MSERGPYVVYPLNPSYVPAQSDAPTPSPHPAASAASSWYQLPATFFDKESQEEQNTVLFKPTNPITIECESAESAAELVENHEFRFLIKCDVHLSDTSPQDSGVLALRKVNTNGTDSTVLFTIDPRYALSTWYTLPGFVNTIGSSASGSTVTVKVPKFKAYVSGFTDTRIEADAIVWMYTSRKVGEDGVINA